MKIEKLKIFAASALLASTITIIPGCHKVVSNDDENISSQTIMTFNNVKETDSLMTKYKKLKHIEKIYSKIDESSVKIKEKLIETIEKNNTYYTVGQDLMIFLEGKETIIWFSSNITQSDAFSAVASLNEIRTNNQQNKEYLNPSKLKYIIGNINKDISINYNKNGKLEIKVPKQIKKISIYEVTPSKAKELSKEETDKYELKKEPNFEIPYYALTTLRNTEEVPNIYIKNDDTLSVTYDGNYYETYIGYAEKDLDSIPFFNFELKDLEKNNRLIYIA